jgi:hypothetical protein
MTARLSCARFAALENRILWPHKDQCCGLTLFDTQYLGFWFISPPSFNLDRVFCIVCYLGGIFGLLQGSLRNLKKTQPAFPGGEG